MQAVRAVVGTGPAAIVVEDLHALDPASLNLIGELASAPGLPALLVVTSRPPTQGVSPRLAARTLAQLTGTVGVIRQHLGGLDRTEVGTLLAEAYGPAVSPETVRAVYDRTGGNPYRLTELLAAPPDDAPLLAAPGGDGAAAPASGLTAREVEVLSCLAAGMSNKQVASALGISIRTVAVHVSNLLRKTRSASPTEAALWAVRQRVRP